MQIGILPDIHCNVRGLLRAVEGMGQMDAIFCAGDAVYQSRAAIWEAQGLFVRDPSVPE